MIANMILKFRSPVNRRVDYLCEHFPLISSVVLQLAAAVFMIGLVASIGLAGGTVIWLFYRAFGVM